MGNAADPEPSRSLRKQEIPGGVEGQGLALGAALERSRLVDRALLDQEVQSASALDDWENEGGRAASAASCSRSVSLPKLTILQLSADLFRDDTPVRAVIMNALLLLITAATVVLVLNN